MKLPKKWLCEYVTFNVTNDEFVEKMMWRGFECAGVEKELAGVEGVVVGRVLSVSKHENSDHLHICDVDIGSERLTIVTGADNVFDGALVPVAVVGAKLGGREMAAVNMRGVTSYGMLCSGEELGLTNADYPGSEVHGILILQEDYPLGQKIETALGFDDDIFEFEITPNRPDCISVIGMCREAAAALGQSFREPKIRPVRGEGNAADYARVSIENYDLCPRYTARVVKDIVIEPSPAWMQKKLKAVGLRPINNIVDITNYVLVEYGHPMHAFDLACIHGSHIVVRTAQENEVVTTLDKRERPVTPDMLLIADESRGVGIAGVMGGLNSEITDATKAVLFESAVFKGSNIRATARKLRHVTDAASRFIKGVEPVGAELALERAIELVAELKAGTVVGAMIDVKKETPGDREITVGVEHVNALLALNLSAREMADMLGTIGIHARPAVGGLHVTIPHFRTDIESGIEADWDIAEEIARIYGYYNIKPTLMRGDTFRGRVDELFRLDDQIKDTLVSLGLYEMYNYNFTSPSVFDALLLPEGSELRKAVRILNPFGEDQSLMRTTLIPGMLDSLVRNANRKSGHLRFFEVGNTHVDTGAELPEERKKIGVVLGGEGVDFYLLKGMIEELFRAVGVKDAVWQASGESYLQPGRAAQIRSESGEQLGVCGELHPDVAGSWKADGRVYVAELNFAAIAQSRSADKRFEPLPRFPAAERDLAVVVDAGLESIVLRRVIENAPAGVIVSDVRLFDTYVGLGIPSGKKSLAFSFSLRAEDHTLTDEEIKRAMDAIIDALQASGAPLRA
ncbi:MAG: phenylalanine--tRNA ligase subunit beta [Clostridiales bacterium]|nr:phenylalanine--tRNA ligase subunit beta [Clostridiales bacterium]